MQNERVCAAGTALPDVSRRAALGAIGACGILGSISASGWEPVESPIQALFRQYNSMNDRIGVLARSRTDEELEPYYDELFEVHDRLMAIPAQSAEDFAAKVIVDTCRGSLFSDWEDGEFWKEARQLVGMRHPT